MQSEQYRNDVRDILMKHYFGDIISAEQETRARLKLQEYLIPVVAVRFIAWNLTRVLMQDGSVATFGELFGDFIGDNSPW